MGHNRKATYHKDIIFTYPIYCSNLPQIVRDFICKILTYGKKNVFLLLQQWSCLATMVQVYLQDCSSNTTCKYGMDFTWKCWTALWCKNLKRTPAQNKQIVMQAEERIKLAMYNLKNGTPTKNSLWFLLKVVQLERIWCIEKGKMNCISCMQ